MKKIYILPLVFLFSVFLSGQTSSVVSDDFEREILMTFIAPSDVSPVQVVDFLQEQTGVYVIQFCRAHNAVYASIDLSIYKQEDVLFRLVETSFPGTACFRKECKERDLNDFFKLCYEEIAKPIE